MPNENLCPWVKDGLDTDYHNNEWGFPQHNDAVLFEFIILEGMQAGLSWNLILKRRENMRQAFDGFNPVLIAEYDEAKQQELLQNPGIIRNRAKIKALIGNAKAFLQVQQEFGSFDAYIWGFVNGAPICNHWEKIEDVPAYTEISDKMSADLKKRGFKFVGTTICYSFMQACGLVNDHLISCPHHKLAQQAAQ